MLDTITTLAKEPSPAVLGMLFALAMIFLTSMRPGRNRGSAWERGRNGARADCWQVKTESSAVPLTGGDGVGNCD